MGNLASTRGPMLSRSYFLIPSFKGLMLAAAIALVPSSGQCQGFPPISPDQLKMTSDPNAPGAPAIFLYREQDSDDNGMTSHEDNYIRIKVLTEEGRKYGNIEISYQKGMEKIAHLEARTIEPDGSSVEFTGSPFDETIMKFEGLKYFAKTFTMPEVKVGSILEYRYTIDLDEHRVFSSHWILNGRLFTRQANFSLRPYSSGTVPVNLRWTWRGVPSGTAPKVGADHVIRMQMENIPAFQEEDFMPPATEVRSRVDFTYETEYREGDPDQYWRHVAREQNRILEKFVDKGKAMAGAVAEILAPSDTPETKLRKIYRRVQQFRNRSYEITKTVQEQKRDKERPADNVEDVWKRGYGSHRQLNWLFLALARAAGFEAHGVLVSSQKDYFFNPKTMERWKLNMAIVRIKSEAEDLYFDPGAEFNSFGMLTSETGAEGLELDKGEGKWIKTPIPDCSESRIVHSAQLKLTEEGTLEGKVRTTYTGLEAMYRRLDVRNSDDITRRKFLEDGLRNQIPIQASATLTNSPDWDNAEGPLVAEFKISVPGWISSAGKHSLIPASLFSAGEKHTFERSNRIHPIYFRYPYEKEDDVTIELPSGWKVFSVPARQVKDGHTITYSSVAENNQTAVHLTRKLAINSELLDPRYYPPLRDLYQNIRAADEQQIVLEPSNARASN